ncbi:PREDICTED: nuclear pore complex protein Nup85-like [Acropora digitifera]|uniref:nuclear pore complex protein Nup85-like n=1 Tax=Acropora digitifera TaxID=70779 RepID=UPI00077B2242|nr:PREDICTED: nuclear pore complex protein Nup85-like [Acropora digitifera]
MAANEEEESMSGNVANTVIPGCQNLRGYWAPGHRIVVHTSEGKSRSAQNSTHYRYPVLHEVCWGADLQSTITRKLINETHGNEIFEQRHLLTLIETVWHLCEILFIETLPGGAVLHHLLEWVQNGDADKYVKDVLQQSNPHDSPSYWPAIYSLVLQGRVNDVCELLAHHPDKQSQDYNDFESMDELLRKMPTYQLYMGQTLHEFTMKWSHWQQECKRRLENKSFAGNPHLNTLCRILCGEEEVFDEVIEYCKTWYHLLVAKLLYCNPAIKSFDLQYHTQSCIDKIEGSGNFDRILLSAFEFDVHAVIKESSDALGNWWFVAHLTDLLHHCGQLDSHHVSHSISLREYLLLEYAASLMSNHREEGSLTMDLLEAVDSLLGDCERYFSNADRSMAENLIHGSFVLRFLSEYCQSGGFSNLDLIDNLGSAMLLSDRLTFLGKEKIVHFVSAFTFKRNDGSQAKDFKSQTYQIMNINLFAVLIAVFAFVHRKRLWLTLLTDSIPLLEHREVIFSSSQTYELMHCLDEIRLSFRTQEYLGHPSKGPADERSMKSAPMGPKSTKAQDDEDRDKIELIRLALARNLSRTIL